MKKLFAFILAMVMVFSMSATAFAADIDTNDVEIVPAEQYIDPNIAVINGSVSGYAHRVCNSESNTFNVEVSGSFGLTGGLTFKTECDYAAAFAVISIQRPNGAYMLYQVAFDANEEAQYNFLLPTPGTYIVTYVVYAPTSTMHMQCWIY